MVTRLAALITFFILLLTFPFIFIYYIFKIDLKGFLVECKFILLIGLIIITGNDQQDSLYQKYSKEHDQKIKEKIDKLSK